MSSPSNNPDRRPIATRELSISKKIAAGIARTGLSANAISVIGMLFGFGAAAILLQTARVDAFTARWLFLAAAACIQLRLLCNMLDGMVALATGTASPLGELFNELPDRLSDTAILIAAGYAYQSDATLGWSAAAIALFVTYIRALGKGAGVPGLFQGPMAKSHRMFVLTVSCVALAILPPSMWPAYHLPGCGCPVGLTGITLLLILVGGIVTAVRRTAALVRGLKERA